MTDNKLLSAALSGMLFIVVLLLSACSTMPEKPNPIPRGDYTYAKALLTRRIEQLMADQQLPGFSIALIDDQEVAWRETFGWADVKAKKPMAAGTIFRLGSISKVVTAVEIMRLHEEGLIDLDAPVTKYLPGFTIQKRFSDDENPITIRTILAHRSGLPRNGTLPAWYWDPQHNVLRDQVLSLKDAHAAYPPGRQYKYSNVGYVLLGRIIETLRDQLFPYYMKKHLFEPMGMKDSAFLKEQVARKDDIAMGHRTRDGDIVPMNQYDVIYMPASNLYGSVEDLAAFMQFIFRGGEAGGRQLIKAETLADMFEVQYSRDRDPQELGLGWFTDRRMLGEKLVFHSGICHGTFSFMAFLPERKLGIIMSANSARFEDRAIPLVMEGLELMRETRDGITLKHRFAGRYIAEGEVVEICTDGEEIWANARGFDVGMDPMNPSRYALSHWLVNLGRLDVEFFPGDTPAEDIMLLTVEGSYRITCPRYPDVETVPPLWDALPGKYRIHTRIPSRHSKADVLGETEIRMEDNVLLLSGLKAALWPLNDSEILILGGPFGGETMTYDRESGNITRQNMIYKPHEKP